MVVNITAAANVTVEVLEWNRVTYWITCLWVGRWRCVVGVRTVTLGLALVSAQAHMLAIGSETCVLAEHSMIQPPYPAPPLSTLPEPPGPTASASNVHYQTATPWLCHHDVATRFVSDLVPFVSALCLSRCLPHCILIAIQGTPIPTAPPHDAIPHLLYRFPDNRTHRTSTKEAFPRRIRIQMVGVKSRAVEWIR